MKDEGLETLAMVQSGLELLRDVIDHPQEARAAFHALNRMLHIDTTPLNYTSGELARLYRMFCETPRHVPQENAPTTEREIYKTDVVERWDGVEFQAMWHVLRHQQLPDADIRKMDEEGQNRQYLEALYAAPKQFCFFTARERALGTLASLGFIRKEDYTITL